MKEKEIKMQKRLMATVVFSGDLDPDPAAAAAALRKAGYEVVMMPEKFRKPLDHPRDDFMEVTKCIVGDEVEQAIDAMMADVEVLVRRYGAMCNDCGQINEHHVPFSMPR
jgi:hypothetical protein